MDSFPLQQLHPHSLSSVLSSHAHAEFYTAISELDLFIHHIPELGYSSQMYFICVTMKISPNLSSCFPWLKQ